MAMLMQKYKLSNGLVSDQAYFVVGFLSGNKNYISATIRVYMSKEASDSSLSPIDEFSVVFTPDTTENSINYHTQTYKHLKTLPQFENAIDVID